MIKYFELNPLVPARNSLIELENVHAARHYPPMETPSPNQIFADIKAVCDDNKKLHAYAVQMSEKIRILAKFQESTGLQDDGEFKHALSVLDDPTRAKAWLLTQLKKGMENAPNAQIAKELRDLLGIMSNDQSMIIQTIDYKNALLNCPKCGHELAKQDDVPTEAPLISGENSDNCPKS